MLTGMTASLDQRSPTHSLDITRFGSWGTVLHRRTLRKAVMSRSIADYIQRVRWIEEHSIRIPDMTEPVQCL